MKIKKITIESEITSPIIGGKEFTNDNSDVWVEFENGESYVALFFTYQNIEWLKNKNQKTGECLSGKYFWSSDMMIIDSLDRRTVENVISELIETEDFFSIFKKLETEKSIWVFNGARSRHSGGIFENLDMAEEWIKNNRLSGMLTKYPINKGVFEWADENDLIRMREGKLEEKRKDPIFIGGFTTAAMEHYHYEEGEKQC